MPSDEPIVPPGYANTLFDLTGRRCRRYRWR